MAARWALCCTWSRSSPPTWPSLLPKETGVVMANDQRAPVLRLSYINRDTGVCFDPVSVPRRQHVSLSLSVAIFSSPRRALSAERSQQQGEQSQGYARRCHLSQTSTPGLQANNKFRNLLKLFWVGFFLSLASESILILTQFPPQAPLSCKVWPPVDPLSPSIRKRPLSV